MKAANNNNNVNTAKIIPIGEMTHFYWVSKMRSVKDKKILELEDKVNTLRSMYIEQLCKNSNT